MTNRIVTVSRQLGSRGSYIAVQVAIALGWRYVDREVIRRAASHAAVAIDTPQDGDPDAGALRAAVDQIVAALDGIPSVPVIASATLRESYHSDEMVADLIREEQLTRPEAELKAVSGLSTHDRLAQNPHLARELVRALAGMGGVVLVGRGAQVILGAHSGACHVRVHAPASLRADRLVQRMGIDPAAAHRQVRDSDRARAQHLMTAYGRNWTDVDLYHLVVNTGRVSVEMATHLIVSMIEQPAV